MKVKEEGNEGQSISSSRSASEVVQIEIVVPRPTTSCLSNMLGPNGRVEVDVDTLLNAEIFPPLPPRRPSIIPRAPVPVPKSPPHFPQEQYVPPLGFCQGINSDGRSSQPEHSGGNGPLNRFRIRGILSPGGGQLDNQISIILNTSSMLRNLNPSKLRPSSSSYIIQNMQCPPASAPAPPHIPGLSPTLGGSNTTTTPAAAQTNNNLPHYPIVFANGFSSLPPPGNTNKAKSNQQLSGDGGTKNSRSFPDSSTTPGTTSCCKRFICDVCGKEFKLLRLLNRHLKGSHSDYKRYHCTFCNKGFNDNSDLKRHTRIHTGIRPFKCNSCDKSFAQRCTLEGHSLRRHGVQHQFAYKEKRPKVYICEDCGHTTEQAEVHYNHLKEHHASHPALLFYDKRHFGSSS